MKLKNNIISLSYFLIFFFLLFEILFSEKNIFNFLNNHKVLSEKKMHLKQIEERSIVLDSFLENFNNLSMFREIIIKEKLFYKAKDEKVLRYKIIPE